MLPSVESRRGNGAIVRTRATGTPAAAGPRARASPSGGMAGTLDDHRVDAQRRAQPMCLGHCIREVRVARPHHHQRRHAAALDDGLGVGLGQTDHRAQRLHAARLAQVGRQRRLGRGVVRVLSGGKSAVPICHPKRHPPQATEPNRHSLARRPERRAIAHDRAQQHHCAHTVWRIVSSPQRRPRRKRVAQNHRGPSAQMPDQGQCIAAHGVRRIVAPARLRLAVAHHVHGHDTIPRLPQQRPQRAVLRTQAPRESPRPLDPSRPCRRT